MGCTSIEELTERVDGLENRMTSVEKILDAHEKDFSITSIQEIQGGYSITFSDGTSVVVYDLESGEDGESLFKGCCFDLYARSFFTAAEMARPSARPASFLVAMPITLPMSCGLVAPTSAMIFVSSASSSASVSCLGR